MLSFRLVLFTIVASNVFSQATKEMYLGTDIPWDWCATGWGSCLFDRDFKSNTVGSIDINGQIFNKGFVAHASGSAKFTLGGYTSDFRQLAVCIGISKFVSDGRCGVTVGDARFRILGDARDADGILWGLRVLRDWQTKGSPEDATCFTVNITGVDQLVLETDLNGSRDCDLSTWANARVVNAASTLTYAGPGRCDDRNGGGVFLPDALFSLFANTVPRTICESICAQQRDCSAYSYRIERVAWPTKCVLFFPTLQGHEVNGKCLEESYSPMGKSCIKFEKIRVASIRGIRFISSDVPSKGDPFDIWGAKCYAKEHARRLAEAMIV